MPTLVYILGRRYCGSTLLSALLNHTKAITSLGEVIEAARPRPERPCTCGAPVATCTFLQAIRTEFEARSGWEWAEATRVMKAQSDPRRFVATWTAAAAAPWVRRLCRINEHLTAAAAEVGGTPFVLDASKEVARGLFLARFHPDVRFLHLVRDPERLAASQLKRLRQGAGFSVLGHRYGGQRAEAVPVGMSGIGWTMEYALGEVVRHAASERVLRVRYEDLAADPHRELRRIGLFLGCDVQAVLDAIDQHGALDAGHSFGGNAMRLRGPIVFEPEGIPEDPLPRRHRLLTRVACWPMMLRYGYRLGWKAGATVESSA